MQIHFELLKKLSETPGNSGREYRIRNLILETLKPVIDEWNIDALGNLITIRKGKDSSKRLMLAAHMDEIGFMISHVTESGFAKFIPLGGFDPRTLVAQRVIVHTREEDLIGVLALKPIHLMTDADKKKELTLDDFFIDFGLPGEIVKQKVQVGDVVTRERECIPLGDCVCGKSLDNRVSVFVLIEAMLNLQEQPPFDVYAVFTVQEEIGLRGAEVAARTIQPHWGMAIDTTIAYDLPDAKEGFKVTELGKGVAIKHYDSSVVCDRRMIDYLISLADTASITWQHEILPRGGTDTGMLQRAGLHGAIAGAISIPTRHIHTVVEMVHQKDVANAILLLKHAILQMNTFSWNYA